MKVEFERDFRIQHSKLTSIIDNLSNIHTNNRIPLTICIYMCVYIREFVGCISRISRCVLYIVMGMKRANQEKVVVVVFAI